ncbi:GTP 3',8-cyclase MoaA [Thermovibrio ammonificans]
MAKVNYLRVSVTDRCNFRCRYCMPEGVREFISHKELLTYEEITEIVKTFAQFGVNSVRLTGGEPLIRRGVENLVSLLSEVPGITEITATTNGFLLKEKAGELKKRGLKRVNVSLDTLDPKKFAFITGTTEKALRQVIEGIREAKRVGLTPVKINTVVIRGFNDTEVLDLVAFAAEEGVEIRFIEVMPVGGPFFSKERFVPLQEVKEKVERAFGSLKPVKVKKQGPAKSFKPENLNVSVGFIPSVSEHFCDSCNRLRLTSDGKLRLCLMSEREIDLKSIIRSEGYRPHHLKLAVAQALLAKSAVNGVEALESLGCSRKMFTIGG